MSKLESFKYSKLIWISAFSGGIGKGGAAGSDSSSVTFVSCCSISDSISANSSSDNSSRVIFPVSTPVSIPVTNPVINPPLWASRSVLSSTR